MGDVFAAVASLNRVTDPEQLFDVTEHAPAVELALWLASRGIYAATHDQAKALADSYIRGLIADADPNGNGMPAIRASVYRMFDADGRLLYVGLTARGAQRIAEHSGNSQWWSFVASITVEHFDRKTAARRAEHEAIQDEAPLYNIRP